MNYYFEISVAKDLTEQYDEIALFPRADVAYTCVMISAKH